MRLSPAQSHARFPLTRLLGNGGNVRVLRALVAYGGPLSASQLAQESGLTPQGTRLVLDSLVGQQVVTVLGQPRTQLFGFDARHPLAGALTELFRQEQARWEALLGALRTTMERYRDVEAAWLYGSVARGEDEPRSDLDIALVVAGDAVEGVTECVREELRSVEDALSVNCSVVGLSEADMARLAPSDPWWQELARDAKVLKGMAPAQLAERCRGAQPA